MNSGVPPLDQIMPIFANNEQASLVLFIAHAEHDLIKLKSYNNLSAQAFNNISECAV